MNTLIPIKKQIVNNFKISYTFCFIFFINLIFAQQPLEPIKIEGYAQGTTYHITYFDSLNRDFKPEIEKILQDFDKSVSTYLPTSIISRINVNQKNVEVDAYFIACFNKAKQVYKNTNGAFDPTVFPLVNAWGFGPGKKQKIEKAKIERALIFELAGSINEVFPHIHGALNLDAVVEVTEL